jgi:hypothetical protein
MHGIAPLHKTMRLSDYGRTLLSFILIIMVGTHVACAASPQVAVHAEGEYYGRETVAFSLLMTQDRFIKSYSNGITIVGTKTAQGPIYHFIKNDRKIIIKVSQDNLYRIGEMTNWETMTRLTRFIDGAGLMRESRTDAENSCRWYNAEKQKVRLCMNERFGLPVYVESKGKTIAHVKSMTYTKASVDPKAVVSRYLKDGYRFVDADEDISPDTD